MTTPRMPDLDQPSRWGWAIGVALAATTFGCAKGALGAGATSASAPTSRAHKWLAGQQNPKTGLVRSYDMPGDRTTWTYDQALAILAFLAVGDTPAAAHCGNGMLAVRDAKLVVWVDGYDVETEEVTANPVAAGPNAWMGLAMLALHNKTKEEKYLKAAIAVGDFLFRLQITDGRTDGVIAGGFDQTGRPFQWASTEHNADAIAFLVALADVMGENRYREAAVRTAKWLDGEMWDQKEGCYLPGYQDIVKATKSEFGERLDSQTWTLLAQVAAAERPGWPKEVAGRARNGLPWIDQYQRECTYKDEKVIGFPKVTHGDRATASFWSEGTAGYILAARRVFHNNPQLGALVDSLRRLQRADGAVVHSVGISCQDVTDLFKPTDLVIAHFEGHPNCLFGQVGVYGDGEPNWQAITADGFRSAYSWYYEPDKPGYRKSNVHSCRQSFRLVNATSMCASTSTSWASLGLDLGPLVNGKVGPVDVRTHRELSFWAKTENKDQDSVKLFVLLRDAHATDFMPQVRRLPTPAQVTRKWQRYVLDLNSIRSNVDLSRLVHVGFAFGADVGNPPGTIIYIDDVAFAGGAERRSPSRTLYNKMPAVFPQHWPFGNVAATAWFVFVELDINPFSCRASRDED